MAHAGREQIVSTRNRGICAAARVPQLLFSGVFGVSLRSMLPCKSKTFGLCALLIVALSGTSGAQVSVEEASLRAAPDQSVRPELRLDVIPTARWDHIPGGTAWTRAALKALKSHGRPLLDTVPKDIRTWCPAFPDLDSHGRAAFWVGLMSALAKHESTYRQTAVGGGGRWYGLLQILPATARGYKCKDPTRAGLKRGETNLTCAVRIMAHTVPRDQVVSQGMRGVAADWGPFHSRKKREDMRAWVKRQDYCVSRVSPRPRARPGR